jgi:hypothetical protein
MYSKLSCAQDSTMTVNVSPCANAMKEGTTGFRQGETKADAAPARAVERRRTPRRPVDRAVVLRLADAGNLGPVPAQLVDLSAGGVGVRLKRPLAPRKQFTLEVGGAAAAGGSGTGDGFALRYQVVRCRPLGHGLFHVGAVFVRTPAAGPVKPSAAAKRA